MREILPEVTAFTLDEPVELKKAIFAEGTFRQFGRPRWVHERTVARCLDDVEVLQQIHQAAQDLARGHVLSSMTTLQKKDGAPFQCTLSAATQCVGHAITAATEANPRATVLSMAYDHVLTSAMLTKLQEKSPGGAAFRTRCVRPTFVLSLGRRARQMRQIHRHEGCGQGDPLMPLLFCFAVRNALPEVKEHVLPGETLFGYLDDVYALSAPTRTRKTHDLLEKFLTVAGIRLHIGKARTWSAWRSLTPSCGAHLESKFLVPLWRRRNSNKQPATSALKKRTSCGEPFRQCHCNALGNCWSSAQCPGATTLSAPYLDHSWQNALMGLHAAYAYGRPCWVTFGIPDGTSCVLGVLG